MDKGLIVGIVGALAAILFMTWAFVDGKHTESIKAEERYTYMGRVTAIEAGDTVSQVYLNSEGEVLPIRSQNLQLAVGEEYEITVDGNWNLVNARIWEKTEVYKQ